MRRPPVSRCSTSKLGSAPNAEIRRMTYPGGHLLESVRAADQIHARHGVLISACTLDVIGARRGAWTHLDDGARHPRELSTLITDCADTQSRSRRGRAPCRDS